MSRDLIVFGEDWGGLPSSTQHLIRHLSQQRKIVWVNSIGLRRPTFNLCATNRIFYKLFGNAGTGNKTKGVSVVSNNSIPSDNFHLVFPKTLPAPRSKLGRWLAVKLLVSQIKPVAKVAGLIKPILWTSLPTAVDVSGHLDESALVYYCGDDFSALAGVDHETVAQREQELVKKADLILASSEKLVLDFSTKTTKLLPHGVDYSLFTTPVPRAEDLPNDGHPIAGFYGSLSEWLDIDLLCETIAQMPDWHFVFIGHSVVDTRALRQFDNVYLLGSRSHQQLPSYSQHWTVSLLPFKDNAQIRACNPLKLSEYLAAGSPIVSTPFPAVNVYSKIVQIVNGSDEMVAALLASEKMNKPKLIEASRNTVVNNSWVAKAQQVSQWMDAL